MAFPKIPESIATYLIKTSQALKLCDNYFRNQYQGKKPPITKDTRCVWYPIDVLEDYIGYIRKIEGEKGEKVDGVRIYFGAYGDNGKEDSKNRKYSFRQTFFMMPTIASGINGKSEHLKHDSIYLDEGSGMVKTIDPLKEQVSGENQNSTLNRGQAFPPPPADSGGQ